MRACPFLAMPDPHRLGVSGRLPTVRANIECTDLGDEGTKRYFISLIAQGSVVRIFNIGGVQVGVGVDVSGGHARVDGRPRRRSVAAEFAPLRNHDDIVT